MRYLLLVAMLACLSSQAKALELSNTITHDNGWVFNFKTKINRTVYPIEIPMNKCEKEDIKKSCFTNERRANRVAHQQAKNAEKSMKEALKAK